MVLTKLLPRAPYTQLVLFMIGEWGRQYRGGNKLVRFLDAETGTEIKAVAVDEVTGTKIGTRPIRIVNPDES